MEKPETSKVRYLVKAGADRGKSKKFGGSPMTIATCRGHVKVLDVLDGSPRRSELLKEIAALLKSHREDDARR